MFKNLRLCSHGQEWGNWKSRPGLGVEGVVELQASAEPCYRRTAIDFEKTDF